jgi:hypothetical protein
MVRTALGSRIRRPLRECDLERRRTKAYEWMNAPRDGPHDCTNMAHFMCLANVMNLVTTRPGIRTLFLYLRHLGRISEMQAFELAIFNFNFILIWTVHSSEFSGSEIGRTAGIGVHRFALCPSAEYVDSH